MEKKDSALTKSIGVVVLGISFLGAKVLCTRVSNKSFLEYKAKQTFGKKRRALEEKSDHFDDILSDTGIENGYSAD
jgi:hypothetical protein